MILIDARNAHAALPQALSLLRQHGVAEGSRNGDVLRLPEPVTTVYSRPLERLVFHPWRDANPFFLCVEALWLLGGRDDLKQLTPYVAKMKDYSDDGGVTSPGSYGKRWRDHFIEDLDDQSRKIDQLNWAVKRLRANPSDRRVVITMWDPYTDIAAADEGGADVPCNLQVLPWVQGGMLHLTVTNRSNDILWGLYSANAVQFGTLLEYMAGRLGLAAGTLTTLSNNFHAYTATMPRAAERHHHVADPYEMGVVAQPLFHDWQFCDIPDSKDDAWREKTMQEDLRVFFEHGPFESVTKARWPYLRQVAVPLALAHRYWRGTRGPDRYAGALEILEQCQAPDWKRSAQEWIKRRQLAYERAQDDGVNHD